MGLEKKDEGDLLNGASVLFQLQAESEDVEADRQMRGEQVAGELYQFNLNCSRKVSQLIYVPILQLSME